MAPFDASLLQMVLGLAALACLFVFLGSISLVDWRTRRIPNILVGALALLRLLVFLLDLCLGQGRAAIEALLASVAVASVFVGAFLVCKVIVERMTHKECLGLGDVKLVAAGFLFLTFDQALVALEVACFTGLALALFFRVARKDATFPFGPALCLGIAIGILA